MGVCLSPDTIRLRLTEWRNLKRLHAKARERVTELEEENRGLKEENKALRERLAGLEDKIERQEEAIGKLREMLFVRHAPRSRTRRPPPPVPRTAPSYRRPAPAVITERKTLALTACPRCENPVGTPQSSRTRIIEDIVLHPEPRITAWTITRHYCASCRTLVEGAVPGVMPKATFGPNVTTLVILARYRWNLPYQKIADVLALSYGLALSEGEIAHLLETAASLVGSKWGAITAAVKAGTVVHCDETGWYIDGEKAWVHVFSTEAATLYEITDTRGKGVAARALGEDFAGTRISDCLPNYKNLPGAHQICWAHLTREAQENAERRPEQREREALRETLDTIYAKLRAVTMMDVWDAALAARTKARCEEMTQRLFRRRWRDLPSRRLVLRMRDFSSALFTCLDREGVPPDNNEAERCLRKLVVQRKIMGGSRAPPHALIHAKLMSVLETLRKEGGDLLANLQSLLRHGIALQLSRQ